MMAKLLYRYLFAVLLLAFGWQTPVFGWKMEAGRVSLPQTTTASGFTRVSLQQSYDTPPLVFSLATEQGSDPSALRIRNVTTTSFEIAQVEPPGNDGPHVAMTIDYLVIEAGRHSLPDGTVFEAGQVSTTSVQHSTTTSSSSFNNLPRGSQRVNFSSGFTAAPAVLGMIQSSNNETGTPPGRPSLPWLTVAIQNVTAGAMDIALERSEVNDGNVTQDEVIAWLAVTPSRLGSFVDKLGATIDLETQQTGLVFDGWSNGCDNQRLNGRYAANPLAFATKRTRQNDDGGWLRRCRLNRTQLGLTVDEDRDNDTERSHPGEAASILVFSAAFIFDSGFAPPQPDTKFKLESASVSLPAGSSDSLGNTVFTKVNLRQGYGAPPYVFAISSTEDSLPTAIRIRNVTTTDFEIAQVGPPGNSRAANPMTVHYVVVSSGGPYQFPDGSIIETGTVATTAVQHGSGVSGSESFDTVSFTTRFRNTPIFLAQIQTLANSTASASVPWLTTAVRNVATNGAELALERSESAAGTVSSRETIAWLAMDAAVVSSFIDNKGATINYETFNTADDIRGFSNGCTTKNFAGSYTAPPLVIAEKTRHDGDDGGWLRRCSITPKSVALTVDEDMDRDTERSHTTEAASVLVFSQPFDADFTNTAGCGPIPAGFPVYAGNGLDVKKDVSVNGSVVSEGKSGNSVALNGTRSDQSQVLPELQPASFPANPSGINASQTNSPFVSSSAIFYDTITAATGSTISFSAGGPFHIDELDLKQNAVVNLAAGIYYINKLQLDEGAKIIISSEPVILHIGDEFDAGKNTQINAAGSVTGLRVLLHEGAEFEAEEQTQFTGLLYAPKPGNIEFKKEVNIHGAVITAGEIKLEKDTRVTLSAAEQTAIAAISTCQALAKGALLVEHDGFGIHCAAETIRVTALDANGNINTAYTEAITLNTQTGQGIWTGTSGGGALSATTNGMAGYQFVAGDRGVVSFTLRYEQGTPTFDIDAFQNSDNAVRDGNTDLITFAANGFSVTAKPFSVPLPNDPVLTQTAGTAFQFTLTAYGQTPTDPVCGIIESYTGDQQLKFWTNNITTGSGVQATINNNPIALNEASAANQVITFNNGQATVTAKYKDVGELNIAIKDDSLTNAADLPEGIKGATNNFVSRPANLLITEVTRVNKSMPAAAVNQDSEVFVAAGEAFRVRVNAIDSEGSLTPSYGKEGEGILLRASTLVAPLGGQNGSLNDGRIGNGSDFGGLDVDGVTLAGGEFVGANFFWDEVGIIRLQAGVADGDYLLTGNLLGSEFVNNVGRFTPFEFLLSEDSGGPQFAPSCGAFTYMDQPFNYATAPQLRIVAVNSNGGTTQNYDGVWWKLANFTEGYTHGGAASLPPGITLDSSLAGHTPIDCSAGNCQGQFTTTFTSPFSYTRGSTPSAPFDAAVSISLSIVDADGVRYAANPFRISDISFSGTPSQAQQRYGRLTLVNVFGSELLDLAMPVRAEYYQDANNGFVLNTEDSCSQFSSSQVVFSNRIGNMAADPQISASPLNLQLGNGITSIPLVATGAGNDGSVDLGIELGASGAAMPWLQFDWASDGNQDGVLDDNPQATATFGIFSGRDSHIYSRERY